MKVSRSVRFSEDLWKAVCWMHKREGGDVSEALRRLVKKGLEREIAELYKQGKVSLRDAADVLSIPPHDTLEMFREMGIQGNISSSQSLSVLETAWFLSEK